MPYGEQNNVFPFPRRTEHESVPVKIESDSSDHRAYIDALTPEEPVVTPSVNVNPDPVIVEFRDPRVVYNLVNAQLGPDIENLRRNSLGLEGMRDAA